MKLSVHISLIRVKIITLTQVGLVILDGDVLVHLCNVCMHSAVNLSMMTGTLSRMMSR